MNAHIKQYFDPDIDTYYSLNDINSLDKDAQKRIMRSWFFQNYERPEEHSPYDSEENTYIYLWGGPYSAREEIDDVFADHVLKEAIDELVSELDSQCNEWSGKFGSEGYNDYYYSAIPENYEFTNNIKDGLNILKKCLKIEFPPDLKQHIYRMLLVNVITILETYLSDVFISAVLKDDISLRTFVRVNPDFAERKLTLQEIFDRHDNIKNEVKTYLLEIIWHNMAKVQIMYSTVLHIEFPSDMKPIYRAIAMRHDIVHRNGKTKSGKYVTINYGDLINIMDIVNDLADNIDGYFQV